MCSRSEAALELEDKAFCLEHSDGAIIDHSLHGFTHTAGQDY